MELAQANSPLDPMRIEITDKTLLRLDAEGGLHLYVTIGEANGDSKGDWANAAPPGFYP